MRLSVSLLALFTLALTPPATAQEDQAPVTELFGDMVQVNVVNVEVYVTDKDGKPVKGLGPDDFEVSENDKPMAVSNFYAVEDGRRVAELRGGEVVAPEAPRPDFEIRPVDQVPEEDKLRLVIFVDNFNIRPNDRERVLNQVRTFISSAVRRNTDQVMLVSYDRGVNVRRPFTSDPYLIADALDEVLEVRGEAGRYDSMRRKIIEDIQRAKNESAAVSAIRPFADAMLFDIERSIDALGEFVDVLAGLPGRKALLHISSGIEMVAGGDLFQAVGWKFESAGTMMTELALYDTSRRFEELSNRANANGVTFYTLDAGGLRTNTAKSAEEAGYDDARIAQSIFSEWEANIQTPLHFMAKETGGRAIVNRNAVLPALEEVTQDFRNYYSLGYMPAHFGDGRYYHINVKLKDAKGLTVRHRDGYRDKSAADQMVDGTRAVLLHPFEKNPLGVEVALAGAEPQGKSNYLVTIQVRIPMKNVVLLPLEDAYQTRVGLYVAAMDERGDLSAVEKTPLGLKIPADYAEAARGETWIYNHKLVMRGGRQFLAFGLRDELGAEETFLRRGFDIGG